MSTGIWLSFALPVMAAMLVGLFTAKKRTLRLIFKGGTTCVALATAVFCFLRGGGLSGGEIIITAVSLFALADVLLDLWFFSGVAAFGLGHIARICWLLTQESALHQSLFTILGCASAAALYSLAMFLFRRTIFHRGKMTISMLIYAAVLALMTGFSLTLPLFGGVRCLPFALGAFLFMISDLLVAQNILVGLPRRWNILAMVIYESSVLLIALCA